MNYNLYIESQLLKTNLLNVDETTVKYVMNKVNTNENSFNYKNQYYSISNLRKLLVFENKKNIDENMIISKAKHHNEFYTTILGNYISDLFLSKLGDDLTSKFQQNFNKTKLFNFIHIERIEELKKIKGNFDLSKLIRLCEELNFNFANQNYYSVAMLGRAIIDHIPPIFGMNSFNEVANNYGSRSIKGNLTHLNNSMRNISDGMLHSHIRRAESIPKETQINFSQDFDVLLGEIILQFNKD